MYTTPNAWHLSHDPCRTVLSVASRTIAAIAPLLSKNMAYRNPKTDLDWGYRMPLKPNAL